jgi:hypothetical protein
MKADHAVRPDKPTHGQGAGLTQQFSMVERDGGHTALRGSGDSENLRRKESGKRHSKLGDSPANLLINLGVMATLQERRLGSAGSWPL